MNRLYFGECLAALGQLDDGSADLIYAAPPLAGDIVRAAALSEDPPDRRGANEPPVPDPYSTWRWRPGMREYLENLTADAGIPYAGILDAMFAILGRSDLMAGLALFAPRLAEMKRILKTSGSIYLHCPRPCAHYLKILADSIMGAENFRSEISVRPGRRRNAHGSPGAACGISRDALLFYSNGAAWTYHPPRLPHDDGYIRSRFSRTDADGRRYRLEIIVQENARPELAFEFHGYMPPAGYSWKMSREELEQCWLDGKIILSPGGRPPLLKRFLDETPGKAVMDDWLDLDIKKSGCAGARKEALLKRIIAAGSEPGALVLDPFCGDGSALLAAEKLGRQWIGIDFSWQALGSTSKNLESECPQARFQTHGLPRSSDDLKQIISTGGTCGAMQFAGWVLFMLGALPQKSGRREKGAAASGYIPFCQAGTADAANTARINVYAFSGTLPPNIVQDIAAALDGRNRTALVVTLNEPSRAMRTQALAEGFFPYPGGEKAPRIQFMTAAELLNGKGAKFHDLGAHAAEREAGEGRKNRDVPRQARLPFA